MLLYLDAAQVIGAVTDTPVDIYEEKGEVNMCQAIRELMDDARAEGLQLVQDMQAWLKEQGRIDDIMQTINDSNFRDKMIEDYKASLKQP